MQIQTTKYIYLFQEEEEIIFKIHTVISRLYCDTTAMLRVLVTGCWLLAMAGMLKAEVRTQDSHKFSFLLIYFVS